MHCRDITTDELDVIASELADAKHQGDDVELVTGQHHKHVLWS